MGKYSKLLECPGCSTLIRPPIYQCETGHSFCSNCPPKLLVCNICTKPLNCNLRNYLAESFCKEIIYPCTYNDKGCTFYQKLDKVIKHENEHCFMRPLACPMKIVKKEAPCNWDGQYEDLKQHILDVHSEMKMIESSSYEYSLAKTPAVFFMSCFGRIFQVCNEKGTHHVHMVGYFKDINSYIYTADIKDLRNKNFNITFGNFCSEQCKKDNSDMLKITFSADTTNHLKLTVQIKTTES